MGSLTEINWEDESLGFERSVGQGCKESRMNVDQLLDSLREHGTIDVEERSFSISLSKARASMVAFQSSNPRRFLVALAAGLNAAGAREIKIVFEDDSYFLSAPGAEVSEAALTNAFGGEIEEDGGGAADLALGLRSGLRCGFQRATLDQRKFGKPGFRWIITPDTEESQQLVGADESELSIELGTDPTLLVKVGRFLQGLRKIEENREELPLLEQVYGCWRVPLWLDGRRVDQGLPSWGGRLSVAVGDLDVRASLRLPARESWTGTLAVQPGNVKLYWNGIFLSELSGGCLSGSVWHRGLGLDISREGLVEDARYEEFLRELLEVRRSLLDWYSTRLSQRPEEEVALYLSELVLLCLEGESPTILSRVSAWLKSAYTPGQLDSLRMGGANSTLELVHLYMEFPRATHFRFQDWEPDVIVLLYLCGQALQERYPGTDQLLAEAADLIERNHPQDTLALGYTLLGLGACLSILGQESPAEAAWGKAKEVARNSGDPKQLILMEAHLEFPTYHMTAEVSKALRICVSSRSHGS
jgi:hypothetical protein